MNLMKHNHYWDTGHRLDVFVVIELNLHVCGNSQILSKART